MFRHSKNIRNAFFGVGLNSVGKVNKLDLILNPKNRFLPDSRPEIFWEPVKIFGTFVSVVSVFVIFAKKSS